MINPEPSQTLSRPRMNGQGKWSKSSSDLPLEDSLHLLDNSGPVFIMGCPRSGTSVLADACKRLLNAITEIGILIPDRIMHLVGSGLLPPDAEENLMWSQRCILWRAFLRMHQSKLWRLHDTLRSRNWWGLRRKEENLDRSVFVYKEPFLIFACEQFARHFPRALFIHIIRNGLDCADSMVRTYPHALRDEVLKDPYLGRLKGSEIGVAKQFQDYWLPWWLPAGTEQEFTDLTPFGRYVFMWREMVQKGQALSARLGPKRVLEIRYEDFCKRPQEVGQSLVEFMGIANGFSFRRFLRTMTTRSVGCHRHHPGDVLEEARKVGAPLLEKLGYA